MIKRKLSSSLESVIAAQKETIAADALNTEHRSPTEVARSIVYTRQDMTMVVAYLALIEHLARSIRRWLIGAVVLLFILAAHFAG